MVVSQAFLGLNDSGTGWAMLLVALNRHLHLMAQIEAARGQRRLSSQLAAAVTELERPAQRWVRQAGRGRPFLVHDRPRVQTQSGTRRGRETGGDRGR